MSERYFYSYRQTIPDYDCDPLLRLKGSATLRYLQRAATEHLTALDLPYERLYAEGVVFVLAGQAVRVARAPVAGETVVVATAPVPGRGAQLLRETAILSETGELLIEGQSAWAMIDPQSQHLLRAGDFHHALPMRTEWQPFADPSRLRIRAPETPLGVRTVRLSDLDRNRHMNNTVYADLLLDCFPDELLASGGLDTLFLRYRQQARLGEALRLTGGFDGQLYAVEAQLDGNCCFEGAFSLRPL
ncbi:MAG: thioesterase [Oscillospiraceae bacterium]